MIIFKILVLLVILFISSAIYYKIISIESYSSSGLNGLSDEMKSKIEKRSNWLLSPNFFRANNQNVPKQWNQWNATTNNKMELIPTPNDTPDEANKSSYGKNNTFDWDIKSGNPAGSVHFQATGGATHVGGEVNIDRDKTIYFQDSGVIENKKNDLTIVNPHGYNYQISKEGSIISDTKGGKGELYVDQSLMTDKINPRKTDKTVFNDILKVSKDTISSSGELHLKGGENGIYGDTHFPWKGNNQNYIRGRTKVHGSMHLYNTLNIKGGQSDKNPNNNWTHFPWNGDKKNYIRGNTRVDGHADLRGNLNAGAFQTEGADISLREESHISGNSGPRRAVVHGSNDELIFNYGGDYTSSAKVQGDRLTANKFCVDDQCFDETPLKKLKKLKVNHLCLGNTCVNQAEISKLKLCPGGKDLCNGIKVHERILFGLPGTEAKTYGTSYSYLCQVYKPFYSYGMPPKNVNAIRKFRLRAIYSDNMSTSGEHTIKVCVGNWGSCEREIFFKLPRTWGISSGSATSWSRDAYSNFIDDSSFGSHHCTLYAKTDNKTGFMKHIVLETWDFFNEEDERATYKECSESKTKWINREMNDRGILQYQAERLQHCKVPSAYQGLIDADTYCSVAQTDWIEGKMVSDGITQKTGESLQKCRVPSIYQKRISTKPDCSAAQTRWINDQMKKGMSQGTGEHKQKCKVPSVYQHYIDS